MFPASGLKTTKYILKTKVLNSVPFRSERSEYSVPVGTAGIFRSVQKTGTEYVIKNFALCTVLFRSEWPELPELPE